MLDDDRIEQARALDIRDEARRLGLDLSKGGKSYFRPGGRGPGGGSPSGSFFRKGGVWRWHDFGEGVGGDVPDLVMHYAGLSLPEALDRLLGEERAPLPPVKYSDPEEHQDVPHDVRARACRAFYDALPPLGDGARAWLETTRAIDGDTVTRFGLRQSDEQSAPLAMGAAIEAVGVEAVVALGLGKPSKHGDGLWCPLGWGCWIAIPYRNGDEVGHLQFRRFHRDEGKPPTGPKYQHIRGEVPYPFNLEALDQPQAMVVEGAFDAMVLEQNGFLAIGIPGVSWMGQGRRAEAVVKRCGSLCVAFDADEAGWQAQKRVEALLWRSGAATVDRAVWPPDFSGDWCDFYREGKVLHGIVEAPRPKEERPLPQFEEQDGDGMPALLDWGDVMAEGLDRIVGEATGKMEKPGLRTGLDGVDEWVRLTEGSYTVIAARPSVGKSHALLSMAYNMAALYGLRVGFLSLEMSRIQCAERIAKAAARIGKDLPKDTSGLVRDAEVLRAQHANLSILIDCPEDRGEAYVSRALDRFAAEGCDVVMVDYVQYIKCKGNGIEERTANASKLCKSWAQRTNIPLVGAAMLKRAENDRQASKRPSMDQLRGSGQIEQDADVILLLHYPWKHDPDEASEFARDLYVEKNRNGLVAPNATGIAYPSPFGFFGTLSYREELRNAGMTI